MIANKRKLGEDSPTQAPTSTSVNRSPSKEKLENGSTPLSSNSAARSAPPSSRSGVASSVLSAAASSARRARRGSIHLEATRIESKHFTAKELQNLFKQFHTWTNKKNELDREGFRRSLGLLGMVQDALLCHQLFRVFNTSGSGRISFEEYVHGLGVLMKGTLDEKLDFSFNMTDIDGSGEISFEELVLTVDSMTRIYAGIMGGGQSTAIDKDRIRKVFAHLDKNNDGTITRDEYKNGMKRHPEFLNTLRGTELFRPLSSSSSSFRAASAKADKLEMCLADVLQEVYRAEDALIALRMMESSAEANGTPLSPTPDNTLIDESYMSKFVAGSKTSRDDDADTGGESSDDRTDSMHTLLKSLARARTICEAQVPHAVRTPHPTRRQQPPKTMKSSAPTTPTSVTSNNHKFEEEEKTAEQQPSMSSPLPAPPPLSNPSDEAMKPSEPSKAPEEVIGRVTGAMAEEWAETSHTSSEVDGLPPLPVSSSRTQKGLTVYFGHKSWDLVVNVMKGIQMAVSRSAMEQDRPVNQYDFGVKEKYTLVSALDSKTAEHRTRFVDYAPFVFAKLRDHFHIDHEEYMNSIGPGSMLSNLMLGSLSSLAEMGSEGKSGSFFYLSSDNRYLVKTVRKDEHKLLRHILPSYFRHMTKLGHADAADSLLTRIVGCHVVRTSKRSKTRTGAQKVYFVVMTNALETDLEIHRKYDLKGSWIGRKTSLAGREEQGKTLKDVDLTESKDRVFVDGRMKSMLMASLRRDASFLESHHIIDYSVLLGIHDHQHQQPPARLVKEWSDSSLKTRSVPVSALSSTNSLLPETSVPYEAPFFAQNHGGFRSLDGKQTYLMGLIDFLTQYGERKRLERFVKSIAHLNSSGLSVMPARMYAKRFLAFMDKRVIVEDVDRNSYFASLETSLSTDLKHPEVVD